MQRVIQEQQTEPLSSYQSVWTPSGLISPQDNTIQHQQHQHHYQQQHQQQQQHFDQVRSNSKKKKIFNYFSHFKLGKIFFTVFSGTTTTAAEIKR